jgi:O-antigen/teichoic acid export membrane protein
VTVTEPIPAGDLVKEGITSSRAVVRSGVANLLSFLASTLYMFLLVPLVLGSLGVEQYGLWSIVMALSGYIGLADVGLSTSFVTYIARFLAAGDDDGVNRVLQHGLLFYIGVTIVVICIGIVGAEPLFDLVELPKELYASGKTALLLALVFYGWSSLGMVYASVLGAMQRMDLYSIYFSISLVVRFLAIAIALAMNGGLLGMMTAELLVTAAGVPVLVWLARRLFPQIRFRWAGYDGALMKTLLRFGANLQVARLAELVLSHFDKLLLARFYGLAAVSMYDFGSRPAGRLRTVPVTAVSALQPTVSALDARADTERIRAALVRSTRYLALLAVPLFGYSIAFADIILLVWLGPGHEQAARTLQLLSAGFFTSVLVSGLAFVALGLGEPEHQMKATLLQSILNVVLSTALVIIFGFYGAVVGTAFASLVGSLLFFRLAGKRIVPHPLRLLVRLSAKPIGCGIPTALLTLGFVYLLRGFAVSGPVVELAISSTVFLLMYAALSHLTGSFTADDRQFVSSVLPAGVRRRHSN